MKPTKHFVIIIFMALSVNANEKNDNPNVWNFQIARKVIAAFQFNGMGMSIWEDQGVENTTIVSHRQFYVTPVTDFLPNSSKCDYNELTGANFVSFEIQLWNDRLQLAAIDRLKQMQIDVTAEQVQPLPFYQVRVIWNNAQQKLQNARLSTTWENNLQQQSIRQFQIFTDDKETCDKLGDTLQSKPKLFTEYIALQYSLSAASTSTRILTVKADHFLNSQLMATLKSMDVQSPERYMTADDANRLTLEVMDNIAASQVVDGDYVPDADILTLKDIVNQALQFQNMNNENFTSKMWESVYWDPEYARPDKVTSYLNKILVINQGNHSISKSNSYSDKGEGGIDFGIAKLNLSGGSNSSTSYAEMRAWLHQHNYDVEIKGELFIPKNRDLQRLNLGVLNRQQAIYTKSVQIHHVDAPGLLAVTTGVKSIVESEDIKKLRQMTEMLNDRLNQVEPRLSQLVPRIDKLEPRVALLEPELANLTAQSNHLNAKLDNGTIDLKNDIQNAKISLQGDINRVRGCIVHVRGGDYGLVCP